MGTVVAGLEEAATSELVSKIPKACVLSYRRGQVVFTAEGIDLGDLLLLRSFDNIYSFLWSGPVGPNKVHLEALFDQISKLKATNTVKKWYPTIPSTPTIYTNASRSGKHSYSRFDAAEAATNGLLSAHSNWLEGNPKQHDLEFRLDIIHTEAHLLLRLTPPGFKYRGNDGSRQFSQAALAPTVAHCLVWMAGIRSDDVFVDPFCGSGTITAERAVYSHSQILSGDISQEAVDAAMANVYTDGKATIKESVKITQWDARNLPLGNSSVDVVVTNLPFGKQILDEEDLHDLYPRFMKELLRVLKPSGTAILLTDQKSLLESASVNTPLSLEPLVQLSLKGLHPWVFRIRK